MPVGDEHGPIPFLPDDAVARADSVVAFVGGHLVSRDHLESGRERRLSDRIAVLTSSIGQAASFVVSGAGDPDALRAAVACFACACGDSIRARAAFLYGDASAHGEDALRSLHALLLASLMADVRWSPALQVAFIVQSVGELVEAAEPLLCEEPGALVCV
jgi:hypothetical protein